MKILFATGNAGKVKEMKPRFEENGHELEQVEVDIEEIDALDVEDIARRKVKDSFEQVETADAVIVEDTGFYVNALEGFPGAKAAFFDRTCGVDKLLNLMRGEDNRDAYFKTAIAFYDGQELKLFSGRVEGKVPEEKHGESHPYLPYDSYFVPEGHGKSFAEDPEYKEKVSQRAVATRKFLGYLGG